MNIEIDPVYIKNADINIRSNLIIKLCNIIHSQYPGEIYGAHPMNENLLIYVRLVNICSLQSDQSGTYFERY